MRGRVLLLNVWATWCLPCRDEIPALQALHDKHKGEGLELVGVSVDASGTDDVVRGMMREYRMTYPVWRDPDELVLARFLTIGVPSTFLVDRGGILRWQKVGPLQPGDTTLAAALTRALAAGS
jgi:thiol-disulfide isomerase/thioredoxin